jgi:uncharacterized protein YidB (DUF937 family)
VGTGQNRRLAPDELSHALGRDAIDELEQQTGMPRQQLLAELSDHLPDAVDQFTLTGACRPMRRSPPAGLTDSSPHGGERDCRMASEVSQGLEAHAFAM